MEDVLRLAGRFLGVALNRTVEEVVEHRLTAARASIDAFRAAFVSLVRALPPGSSLLLRARGPVDACVECGPEEVVAEAEAGRPREVTSVRCGPPVDRPDAPTRWFPSIPNPPPAPDVDPQAGRAKSSLSALLASLPEGARVEVRSEALATIGAPPFVDAAWLAEEARQGRFYDLVAVRLPSPRPRAEAPPRPAAREAVAAVDAAVAGLMASIEGRRAARGPSGGGKGALRGRNRS